MQGDRALPRPRWRNRLLHTEALREQRVPLLGRIPGSGPPPDAPFLPDIPPALVRVSGHALTVRMAGEGIVHCAGQSAALHGGTATLALADPAPWSPHTHGRPTLHPVHAEIGGARIDLPPVGFRRIERLPGPGFALAVNGHPVFCRGALWQGADGTGAVYQAQAAGLNMIRIPGTSTYPPQALLDAADRLGMLVWLDFQFARFDYPATAAFLDQVRAEADTVLAAIAHHPCLAVLCGGDEVHQAAAMAGRPHADGDHPIFDTILRDAAAAHCPGIPYIPNAPYGGTPAFAASAPVTHYFGVGAYQRPLHEARPVRFAAACLAFANPPDAEGCRALAATPGDAAWAAAVPRDPGAAWTFEDVNDHYAATLLGADPAALRRTDPERWLATSRAAVALAMQQALALWRASPRCNGALILGLQDRVPGPGWGLVDHAGRPKSALHAVAQMCRPVQVLLTDEGLDGVRLHLLNDTADPCPVVLTLRGLAPDGRAETLLDCARTLPPHGSSSEPAAEAMGRFRDLTGAWRFGPPPFAVLHATLHAGPALLASATLFPIGAGLPPQELGLTAALEGVALTVSAARFAQFVTVDAGRHVPSEDHFHLWPGEARTLVLDGDGPIDGSVTALNATRPTHFRAR